MSQIHVAVGVVCDGQRVLLSRRRRGVHLEGYLEFPGGKLDAGEKPQAALVRELREELGIEARDSRFLMHIPFDYGTHHVHLHVFKVTAFDGLPVGREGQPLEWMDVASLAVSQLPPANRGIVAALQLPDRCLITPEPGSDRERYLQRLRSSLEGGIRLVQMRAPSLPAAEFRALARQVMDVCADFPQVKVLFNSHIDLVQELGADGVHLTSRQCRALQARPLPEGLLVGASCHDGRELKLAADLGADFVLLSPVRETASHPGAPLLGWDAFAELARQSPVPAYALGGMTVADIPQACDLGGQGVAAISGLWGC